MPAMTQPAQDLPMEAATVVDTIVPVDRIESSPVWHEALWLPCQLTVELVVPAFTIGDLLRMDVESIIDCQWKQNADVPLRVNGLVVGYAEFEVIGDKSAVRLTELT